MTCVRRERRGGLAGCSHTDLGQGDGGLWGLGGQGGGPHTDLVTVSAGQRRVKVKTGVTGLDPRPVRQQGFRCRQGVLGSKQASKLMFQSTNAVISGRVLVRGRDLQPCISGRVLGRGKDLQPCLSGRVLGRGKDLQPCMSGRVLGRGKDLQPCMSGRVLGRGKDLQPCISGRVLGRGKDLQPCMSGRHADLPQ